jgi:hypothetical protein
LHNHNPKKYSLNKHLIPAALNLGRRPEKNGNWKVLLTPRKMTFKGSAKTKLTGELIAQMKIGRRRNTGILN